jgi:hypothetical protein
MDGKQEFIELTNTFMTEPIREIGGLLAIAYQRYQAVQRVQTDQLGAPAGELALSNEPSVHGVVT